MAFRVEICAAILLISTVSVYGYGSGAPASACEGLAPIHKDGRVQNGELPYDFSLSTTQTNAGGRVVVTISKQSSGQSFQGFFLQARRANGDSTPVGQWIPAQGVSKGVPCSNLENSSLTHVDKTSKSQITAEWVAPARGDYVIYATVAEDYFKYWVGHKSQTIKVA